MPSRHVDNDAETGHEEALRISNTRRTFDRTHVTTLRSSAAKQVAQAISGRQGVLGYLLSDERVLRYIDERPAVLLRILEASELLPQLDEADVRRTRGPNWVRFAKTVP